LVKTDAMIPVRDGVKLHTVIFTPRDTQERLPILLERTPYGAMADEKALRGRYAHLIADGYIFAFQDIRGRFQSEVRHATAGSRQARRQSRRRKYRHL
jgi:predicted acyl esterase